MNDSCMAGQAGERSIGDSSLPSLFRKHPFAFHFFIFLNWVFSHLRIVWWSCDALTRRIESAAISSNWRIFNECRRVFSSPFLFEMSAVVITFLRKLQSFNSAKIGKKKVELDYFFFCREKEDEELRLFFVEWKLEFAQIKLWDRSKQAFSSPPFPAWRQRGGKSIF